MALGVCLPANQLDEHPRIRQQMILVRRARERIVGNVFSDVGALRFLPFDRSASFFLIKTSDDAGVADRWCLDESHRRAGVEAFWFF
jgi:hypothetical protein